MNRQRILILLGVILQSLAILPTLTSPQVLAQRLEAGPIDSGLLELPAVSTDGLANADVPTAMVQPQPCEPVRVADFAWSPLTPTIGQVTPFTPTTWIGGAEWVSETIGSAALFDQKISLALDSADRPHIGYRSGGIRYAWHDGTTWISQTVGSGINPSLALDSQDRPHISYRSGGLKYAYHDGSSWQIESVDGGGEDNSLALDSADRPHIGYIRSSMVKHAWYDGTAWISETVDGGHGPVSLALDSAGRPHIAYQSETNYYLKYAWYDGSGWQIETVDNRFDSGNYISLALDSQDRPHISYLLLGDTLQYAHHDGSAWQIEPVDGEEYAGRFSSIAIDGNDLPRISYNRGNQDDLKYAWYDGSGRGWHIETVDAAGQNGWFTSLALDSANRAHIGYLLAGLVKDLKYARQEYLSPTRPISYNWAFGDGSFSSGQFPSHSYDQAGSYAVVLTATNCNGFAAATAVHTLTIIPCSPVSAGDFYWRPTTPTVGQEVTFMGDTDGSRPVSFAWDFGDSLSGTGQLTTHAYDLAGSYTVTVAATNCEGSTPATITVVHSLDVLSAPPCQPVQEADLSWSPLIPLVGEQVNFTGTAWASGTEQLDEVVGDRGSHISLALDGSGRPHISYIGGTGLAYAYRSSSGWITETVDGSVDYDWGGSTSIELDIAGRPHISYYDDVNFGLKYAYFDGVGWTSETVESGHQGSWNSLALDVWGRPHISYQDSLQGELRYAHYDGSAWQIETVDDSPNAGYHTSIVLDSAGYPHISYAIVYYDALIHAWYDGTAWQLETALGGDAVAYTSIFVDDADRPHISSWRYDPGVSESPWELTYAWFDGSGPGLEQGWQSEIVDTVDDHGKYTSIVVDRFGRPHIGYSLHYCEGSSCSYSDVRYAYQDGNSWHIEILSDAGNYPSMALDNLDRLHIAFSDSSVSSIRYLRLGPPPTPPISYTWDLGDGTLAEGATISHSYAVTGSYNVVLTATNACGGVTVGRTLLVLLSPLGERAYLPLVFKQAEP